jgi:tRNA(Ile)-lysidine synthase
MALASVSDVKRFLLQQGMVLRILRTISFYPWGSLQSEAGRRQLSLKQIITKLWNPDPFTAGIKPFVAGGGVLWKPVVFRREKIKDVTRVSDLLSDDTVAWLATRQPPFDKKKKLPQIARDSPLFRDITNLLVYGLDLWKTNNGPDYVEILFDCRFLVSFRLPHIPIEILSALMSGRGKLLLQASSRWYSPLVLYQDHGAARIVHSLVSDDFSGAHSWDNKSTEGKVCVDWIVVKFIRTLNAI